MSKTALIDNDFVQKLAEIKYDNREELVQRVLSAMDLEAKMHELVYEHEFTDINGAGKFLDEGVFSVQKLDTIFDNDQSIAACFIGGYAIFLSDDKGSKAIAALIENDYRKKLTVYNREDVVKRLPSGEVKKTERRMFAHKH